MKGIRRCVVFSRICSQYVTHSIQYGDFAFQVSTPTRWEVFICNDEMVREYRNFTDERFSANAVTAEASFDSTHSSLGMLAANVNDAVVRSEVYRSGCGRGCA